MKEYVMENKVTNTMLEEKIQEAKELLWANGYIVKKFTKEMNKDADKCDASGGDGDCMGCSCNMCIIQ